MVAPPRRTEEQRDRNIAVKSGGPCKRVLQNSPPRHRERRVRPSLIPPCPLLFISRTYDLRDEFDYLFDPIRGTVSVGHLSEIEALLGSDLCLPCRRRAQPTINRESDRRSISDSASLRTSSSAAIAAKHSAWLLVPCSSTRRMRMTGSSQ